MLIPVVMGLQSREGLGQERPSPLTLTWYLSPQSRELMLQPGPGVVQFRMSVVSMANAMEL